MSEVRINITNLHFAKIEENEEGAITYGTPERIIGAEQATTKPKISSGELYGDGVIRFKVSKKAAYEIDLNLNNIPADWRIYIEGTHVSESGVESATSKDSPNPLAVGWEVEKTNGKSEFIWFLFCLGEPIEQTTQQSEENTNFSRDTLKIVALEHESINRFYTFVDTANEKAKDITATQFFKKVQTTDTVATV